MMTTTEKPESLLCRKHFPKNLYEVLAFLSKTGNEAQVSEIKDHFKDKISNPVINDILIGLDIKNYITKKDMKDRRRKLVILTKNGQTFFQTLENLFILM